MNGGCTILQLFSVAKVTLQSQMSVRLSVCPSVTETPQPLRIAPIGHRAYRAYGLSGQSTIKPIDHGLSVRPSITETPKPLRSALIGHRNYQPLSLLTIEPIDH